MQPCLDDFNTTFDDYGEMQVYPAIYEEVLNPPSQRRIKIAAVAK